MKSRKYFDQETNSAELMSNTNLYLNPLFANDNQADNSTKMSAFSPSQGRNNEYTVKNSVYHELKEFKRQRQILCGEEFEFQPDELDYYRLKDWDHHTKQLFIRPEKETSDFLADADAGIYCSTNLNAMQRLELRRDVKLEEIKFNYAPSYYEKQDTTKSPIINLNPIKKQKLSDSQDTNISTIVGHEYRYGNPNLKKSNQSKNLQSQNKNMDFRKKLFSSDYHKDVDMLEVEICMERLVERIHGYTSSEKKIIATRESSLSPLKPSIEKFCSSDITTKQGLLGSQFNNEKNTATKLSQFLPKLLAFHGFNYVKLKSACLDDKLEFSWTRGFTNLTQWFEDALVEDMWTRFWPQSISIKLLSKIITDHIDTACKLKKIEKNKDTPQNKVFKPYAKQLLRQIYVGNLDKVLTSEVKIRAEFSSFGPISSIILSGRSESRFIHSGYAFVTYETPDAVEMALEMDGLSIDSRNIKIGRPSQFKTNYDMLKDILSEIEREAENQNRLYVANIDHNWTERNLKAAFGHFGTILDCKLPTFCDSVINRGFCYIDYSNAASLNEAISIMNSNEFAGRKMKVRHSMISHDDLTVLIEKKVPLPNHSSVPTAINPVKRQEEQERSKELVRQEDRKLSLQMMKKMFVGNLNFKLITEAQLHAEFSPFGPIKNIDLHYRFPTAYAFIDYLTPDAAELALEMDGVTIDDRDIRVRHRDEERVLQSVIDDIRQTAINQNRIYVANISSNLLESDVRSAFEVFGKISDIQFLTFINKLELPKKSKKFCYILFSDYYAKERALNRMNLYDLDGQKLRVGSCMVPDDEISELVKTFGHVPEPVLLAVAKVENELLGQCSLSLVQKELNTDIKTESDSRNIGGSYENDIALIEIKKENTLENINEKSYLSKGNGEWKEKNDRGQKETCKKSSRWSEKGGYFSLPTVMPPGFNKEQEEVFMLKVKISEITEEIKTKKREYSFDQRKHVEEIRHGYIKRINSLTDHYNPPVDYIPATFDDGNWMGSKDVRFEDVYIPKSDTINYMCLLLGPKGKFLKSQAQASNTYMYIRGIGSEKHSTNNSIDPNFKPSRLDLQPLHVHVEAKYCDKKHSASQVVREGARRIELILQEITDNPNFLSYLRIQHEQDHVLFIDENSPIEYIPPAFFELGKWVKRERLPSEDVYLPSGPSNVINYKAMLIGPKGKFLKSIEQATNTKMTIWGTGTYYKVDKPLHVHVVAATEIAVRAGVNKIKSFLDEVKNNQDIIEFVKKEKLQDYETSNSKGSYYFKELTKLHYSEHSTN